MLNDMDHMLDIDPAGIVWDLDNTLYPMDAALEDGFHRAVALAAIEWGVDMSPDEAFAMARQSYIDHRYSALVFIDRFNIPFADMHFMINKNLDHQALKRCEDTRAAFAAMDDVSHALITHAARDWAFRALDHLGLRDWFPEERIFGFENYDFESKAKSRRAFEMALDTLNRNPQDCVMVEDTLENLRVPHEMGMKTVFVHHGNRPANLPDFVHYDMTNATELMRRLYSSASG